MAFKITRDEFIVLFDCNLIWVMFLISKKKTWFNDKGNSEMPFCKKPNYSSEKKFYNKINKLIKNFLNKIQHKTMNKAVTKLFFLYTLMIFFFKNLPIGFLNKQRWTPM